MQLLPLAAVTDPALLAALQSCLQVDGALAPDDADAIVPDVRDVEIVRNADDTIEWLVEHPEAVLIADCRPEFHSPVLIELIRRLAGRAVPQLRLIALSDGFLPEAITAEVLLLASAHVQLDPADTAFRMLPPLLKTALDHLAEVLPLSVPEHREAKSNHVSLRTYTPEFFPVMEDLQRVAGRDVTLLLIGETGTGKTTMARFVHDLSPRKNRQFQNLACGALPMDLIESELFGHIRGAFTGADRNKMGRFEAAGQGTLLLDEIDVLDLKQQTRLLKVIETGEYEMVGSTESRKSEARLIVASNVNLNEMQAQGRFRADLYYRLNVLEFKLPALRERPLDVPFLAMQFVSELCREHQIEVKKVHRDFIESLQNYSWPGNLRELKNHISRAVLFCQNGELSVNDLSHKIVRSQFEAPVQRDRSAPRTLADRVAVSERALLIEALQANGNNRTKTARALGISRVGLYKKMRRLGLQEVVSAT